MEAFQENHGDIHGNSATKENQTFVRDAAEEDEHSDKFSDGPKREYAEETFVNNGFDDGHDEHHNAQASQRQSSVVSNETDVHQSDEISVRNSSRSPAVALDSVALSESHVESHGDSSSAGNDYLHSREHLRGPRAISDYEPHFVSPVVLNDLPASAVQDLSRSSPPLHTMTEVEPVVIRENLRESSQSPELVLERTAREVDSADAENDTVVHDDNESKPCPVPYAVPIQPPSPEAAGETSVRDTDLSTSAAKAEEKIAEIAVEWQDVMGNRALMKRTVKKGQSGTRPARNSIVTIRCNAVVLDNNDLDPSSILKTADVHDSLRFTVGDLEVIQGLELAVQLMDIGEISEVKLEPRFGYGEIGNLETGVPPEASLLYTIELLTVEPPVDLENLSVPERVALANHKVDRGNFWYLRKEAMLALSLYQRAVSVLEAPVQTYSTPEDNAALDLAKARAYGNLSSAQVEEQIWDEGLRSVESALRYDPNNGKLWCRKIKILREKGRYEEAVETCEEVVKRGTLIGDQFSKKARDEMSNMRKKKRQADEKEKAMYQRMLGSSPKPASELDRKIYLESKNSSGSSATSSRKWLMFASATAVAVFGVVIGLRYYQQHH